MGFFIHLRNRSRSGAKHAIASGSRTMNSSARILGFTALTLSIHIVWSMRCTVDTEALIDAQNTKRMKHGVNRLIWSKQLALNATNEAKRLVDFGKCLKSSRSPMPGTITQVHSGYVLTEEAVVDHWYGSHSTPKDSRKEELQYRPFIQMLWPKSLQVGCARKCCSTGDVWVCQYYPSADPFSAAERTVLEFPAFHIRPKARKRALLPGNRDTEIITNRARTFLPL